MIMIQNIKMGNNVGEMIGQSLPYSSLAILDDHGAVVVNGRFFISVSSRNQPSNCM